VTARTAARLAWSLWSLAMALEVAAILLWLANHPTLVSRFGTTEDFAPQVFLVPGYATVGAVIRHASATGSAGCSSPSGSPPPCSSSPAPTSSGGPLSRPGRRRDWQAAQAALERLAGWSRHRHYRQQPHLDRADRDRPGRRLDRTAGPQERDGR
jgi:hypothetical protein